MPSRRTVWARSGATRYATLGIKGIKGKTKTAPSQANRAFIRTRKGGGTRQEARAASTKVRKAVRGEKFAGRIAAGKAIRKKAQGKRAAIQRKARTPIIPKGKTLSKTGPPAGQGRRRLAKLRSR